MALAIGAALTAAASAEATSVTSTTFASWKASLTGSPSEANFGVIALTSYNTAGGLTLPTIGNSSVGTTVTGPDNGSYQMTGVDYNSVKSLEGSADAGAGLSIALPNGGVNAFLLAVGSTGGTPLTVTLSDGEVFSIGNGLWGISISHTVSSLLLTTSAGSQAVIDDFYFGTSNLAQDSNGGSSGSQTGPAPVAEAATSLMIAGGCLFLFGIWRRVGTPNPA
jgi:hypothetical protein